MEVRDPLAEIPRIRQISDPAERAREIGRVLNELIQAQAEVRAMRQEAVLEMRAAGMSYGQIAEALGVHRNRVQQIAEGRAR